MFTIRVGVAIMGLILLCTSAARAQNATITWASGSPNNQNPGQISGGGAYTVAQGWVPTKVVINAYPKNGGMTQSNVGTFDTTLLTWGARVSAQVGVTYSVVATITVMKTGTMMTQTYNTTSVDVTVNQ